MNDRLHANRRPPSPPVAAPRLAPRPPAPHRRLPRGPPPDPPPLLCALLPAAASENPAADEAGAKQHRRTASSCSAARTAAARRCCGGCSPPTRPSPASPSRSPPTLARAPSSSRCCPPSASAPSSSAGRATPASAATICTDVAPHRGARAQQNASSRRLVAEWGYHWDLSRPILAEKTPTNMVASRLLQARAQFGASRNSRAPFADGPRLAAGPAVERDAHLPLHRRHPLAVALRTAPSQAAANASSRSATPSFTGRSRTASSPPTCRTSHARARCVTRIWRRRRRSALRSCSGWLELPAAAAVTAAAATVKPHANRKYETAYCTALEGGSNRAAARRAAHCGAASRSNRASTSLGSSTTSRWAGRRGLAACAPRRRATGWRRARRCGEAGEPRHHPTRAAWKLGGTGPLLGAFR